MISKTNQEKITNYALDAVKKKEFKECGSHNIKSKLQKIIDEYAESLNIGDDIFVMSVDSNGRFQLSFY